MSASFCIINIKYIQDFSKSSDFQLLVEQTRFLELAGGRETARIAGMAALMLLLLLTPTGDWNHGITGIRDDLKWN